MSDGAAVPAAFWRRARSAPHRLLMLDYDGTLVPHLLDRFHAAPAPVVLGRLRRIASGGGTTLAVVSGRTLADLSRFLGELPAVLIGEHGWEERRPDGAVTRHPVPPEAGDALDRAARLAAGRAWAPRLEVKRSGIALHTRGLPDHEVFLMERDCARLWEECCRDGSVRLRAVRGGLELRACGRHKGLAVAGMIDAAPEGSLPVYVGDDETDEDAFREIRDRGFGFRVGEDDRPSLAWRRLRSWRDVPRFLRRWSSTVEGVDPVLRGEA